MDARKRELSGLNVSFPFFGIGLILFGLATFRAGVYPRRVALLLRTFQESIGQILLGIAVAALGWHGLRKAPSSTLQGGQS